MVSAAVLTAVLVAVSTVHSRESFCRQQKSLKVFFPSDLTQIVTLIVSTTLFY